MKLHEIKKSIRDGYARYRAVQYQNFKEPLNFRDWQELCADHIERNFNRELH